MVWKEKGREGKEKIAKIYNCKLSIRYHMSHSMWCDLLTLFYFILTTLEKFILCLMLLPVPK